MVRHCCKKSRLRFSVLSSPKERNLSAEDSRRHGEALDCPLQYHGAMCAVSASGQADYIHGGGIFVDGGMMLYPGFEAGS